MKKTCAAADGPSSRAVPDYRRQDSETAKLVMGRQKQLESLRTVWEAEWQEVADHVIPLREDVRGMRRGGERQGTKIYDGTAVGALQLFADGLHGYLISPAIQWFKLQMTKTGLDDIPEVKAWLQEVEWRLYAAFNRSNFYESAWMYLYDGGSLGTASLYIEEDIAEGRIVFETIHPGEVYIAENKYGEVDLLHRKRKITARQAVQMFGEAQVGDAIRSACAVNPFQEFTFLHCVFPREEFDDRKLDCRNKRYASIWFQPESGRLCRVSGYDEFPYAVWRYSKSGKEAYGRSPAMTALADIKGLNIIGKTLLGAAQLAVDPPMNVPSDMKGKVQLKPRGLNYFDRPEMRISPVNAGINFPVGVDREERKAKIVEQHFHVDFFLMLARAEGRMTATEVMERQGEKAAVLGAAVGRLNSEALNKIIDRVFQIELKAGRLPEPPEALSEFENEPIDVVYMGPLAQAQRRLFRTQGIKQGLEAVLPVLRIFPEGADVINPTEMFKELLEASGFPQKCIRSQEDIAQIRQGRTAAQQQQAQKEDLLSLVEGVKGAAAADKDTGGRLSQLLEGAAQSLPEDAVQQ